MQINAKVKQIVKDLRTRASCGSCDECGHDENLPIGEAQCWDKLALEAADTIEHLCSVLEIANQDITIAPVVEYIPVNNLNEFAKEIHENAVSHGWWDEERSVPEIIALCHSELSEALEEYRCGRPNEWYACGESLADDQGICEPIDRFDCAKFPFVEMCQYHSKKPEGIAVEMADCIIRILDWCGKEGIDIDRILSKKHEYNKSRSFRHGGKKC